MHYVVWHGTLRVVTQRKYTLYYAETWEFYFIQYTNKQTNKIPNCYQQQQHTQTFLKQCRFRLTCEQGIGNFSVSDLLILFILNTWIINCKAILAQWFVQSEPHLCGSSLGSIDTCETSACACVKRLSHCMDFTN